MSLIYNRDNVPSAYSDKSRDYQVLLKLFDLVTNAVKLNLEDFSSLINPETCPNHMLPLLASILEYDYDYNETYDANRLIMRYYPKLMRSKGNEIGIKSAVLLSCDITREIDSNINILPSLDRIIADYDYANATIYIYYPSYLNKVRDLIEVVRPAGMRVVLLTYDAIEAVEVAGIYDDLLIINEEIYNGELSQYTSDPHSYYIIDENNRYIVGIGTDSRSVISDDYREGKTLIIPSNSETLRYKKFPEDIATGSVTTESITVNPGELGSSQSVPGIDINGYIRKIKPDSQEYLIDKPELLEGNEAQLHVQHQARVGFSEVAGRRSDNISKIYLIQDRNGKAIKDKNDKFIADKITQED